MEILEKIFTFIITNCNKVLKNVLDYYKQYCKQHCKRRTQIFLKWQDGALTIVMSCHVILCYIKNVSIRITLLTVGLTVVVGSEKSKTNYLIVTNKKL